MNIKKMVSAIAALTLVSGTAVTLALSHGVGSAKADTATFTVSGQVTMLPSNNTVADVNVTATEPGGNTVDFGPVETNSGGFYNLTVNTGTYDFHFTPPAGAKLQSYVDSSVTISSDQTINAKLPPALNYISGTLTASDGTPLSGAQVGVQSTTGNTPPQAWTCSDSNGHYSLGVWPDTYYVDLTADTSGGSCGYASTPNTKTPTGSFVISGLSQAYEGVDVTTGDAVKDFNFTTAKLTVTAKDSYGNPLVGYNVSTNTGILYESSLVSGGSNTLEVGSSLLPVTKTDNQGQISGYVINGAKLRSGTLCINPYPINSFCSTTDYTVNGDTNITLQQQPVIMPTAPTNLHAESPTSQVNLAWDTVAHATSYNIYRNGQYLANTTQTGYVDNSALPGAGSYYVTAVNGNGESPASNTISVTLNAAPVVKLTAPSNSQTVSDTVSIAGTINASTDYSRMLYVFNSNSQAVVSQYQYDVPGTTTSFGYTWNTAALPNGNYTIVLSAKDLQGRKDAGSTSTIHVTVNN